MSGYSSMGYFKLNSYGFTDEKCEEILLVFDSIAM